MQHPGAVGYTENHINNQGLYFDKQGNPITREQMCELRFDMSDGARVSDYARIGYNTLLDNVEVSTVWLGINHSFVVQGPPVIFETMVFAPGRDYDQDCIRYCTEEEARAGHRRTVENLSDGNPPWHLDV